MLGKKNSEQLTFIFSANNSFISKMVRWFTRSEWSHVDYVYSASQIIGAVAGSGVVKRDIREIKDKEQLQVDLMCTKKQKQKFNEWITKQIGKPYDYTAIYGFMLKRDWQDSKRWFCSELITCALEHAGIKIVNHEEEYKISPRDLLMLLRRDMEKRTW